MRTISIAIKSLECLLEILLLHLAEDLGGNECEDGLFEFASGLKGKTLREGNWEHKIAGGSEDSSG
jgi:hypothetical protein